MTMTHPLPIYSPEKAVKKVTIFFYGEGEAEQAKALSNAERAKQQIGLLRDSATFQDDYESCSRVVILPGVADHHAARIKAIYGELVGRAEADHLAPQDFVDPLTIHGPKSDPENVSKAAKPDENMRAHVEPVRAEHRGKGEWYVVQGDKTLSGPHTKEEARGIVSPG